MYGNTCNTISETKGSYKTSFLSICPKYFFAEFGMLWRTSYLTENRQKTLFCKQKNQTKQNRTKKKGMKRKKAKLICCSNSTPGWTYGKFLSLSYKSDLTVFPYL